MISLEARILRRMYIKIKDKKNSLKAHDKNGHGRYAVR
jgi:hypothetical protein